MATLSYTYVMETSPQAMINNSLELLKIYKEEKSFNPAVLKRLNFTNGALDRSKTSLEHPIDYKSRLKHNSICMETKHISEGKHLPSRHMCTRTYLPVKSGKEKLCLGGHATQGGE